MIDKAERRLWFWWAILVAATLVSVEMRASSTSTAKAAAIAVLIIAFSKTWIVILHFMDVRRAPLALKIALGGWVLAVCAVLIGLCAFH
jgi:hypothetical protein